MLSDLVALLEKDDMRAYALWRELEPSLSLTIGKNDIAAVSQKIEAFDFPSALSILKAVIALHPKLTNGWYFWVVMCLIFKKMYFCKHASV